MTPEPNQVGTSVHGYPSHNVTIYVHGVMVQVMIQLIQHYPIIVFLDRFSLRTNAVVFFEEVSTKAAKPGRVVSSEAMHMIFNA